MAAKVVRRDHKGARSRDDSLAAVCHFGDRPSGRECPHKGSTVSDRRADDFTKADQFVDQLFALAGPRIDAIRHKDKAGIAAPQSTRLINDFKRFGCCLKVESGRRARHDHQIGKGNRSTERPGAGRGVDNDVIKVPANLVKIANPIGDCLIGKRDLINGKLQVAGLSPLAGRPLRIGIDQGDLFPDVESAAMGTKVVLPTPPLRCATAIM